MKIIWKKAGIVILSYYSVVLLQACCSCPDPELPYFDYKSINIDSYGPFPYSLYPEAGFGFRIELDSIHYLAVQENKQLHWGLVNKVNGCSCDGDGYWGEKYGLTEINIYADSVFDASLPSGEPLNSLFEVATHYNSETQKYETIAKNNSKSFNISKVYNDNKFDFGLATGLNYAVVEKFIIGLRYTHGFSSVIKDIVIFDQKAKLLNRTFQLSLGYKLR